jgi:fatty-acyl-CoA synthase
MSGTVNDALIWHARMRPDAIAIDFDGDRVTYRELDSWVNAVATELLGVPVGAGDRVSVVGANCLEWCVAALAGFKVGAVVAPFNQRMVARELAELVEDCEPTVIFHDAERGPRVDAVAGVNPVFCTRSFEDVLRHRHVDAPAVPIPADDLDAPAAIVYTSGTSGRPKGVIFTPRTIAGVTHEWHLIEPVEPHGLRPLLVLPLFTAAGLVWGVARTILHGGTLLLQPRFDPARALERLASERATTLTGPPIIFEQIAAQPGFEAADLTSLTTAHVGGARVPVELLHQWLAKGVALRQIYGQTEIGGSATVMPRDEVAEHPEQCGFGGIFTKIRVVDADGNDAPPGVQGEILLRGPGMMPGYWRNEAATSHALRNGWLHTGDMGVLDERGYLTVVGRLKDMIISGGLNIAPMEIEQVLQSMDGIEEVAVIAVADAKFGETPAALLCASRELTAEEVVAWCNERLADFKVPRYVVFLDEDLPRMASGKINKLELRAAYASLPETHAKVR